MPGNLGGPVIDICTHGPDHDARVVGMLPSPSRPEDDRWGLLRTVGVLIFPFVRFGVRLGVIRAGVYILARTRMDRGSICVIGRCISNVYEVGVPETARVTVMIFQEGAR